MPPYNVAVAAARRVCALRIRDLAIGLREAYVRDVRAYAGIFQHNLPLLSLAQRITGLDYRDKLRRAAQQFYELFHSAPGDEPDRADWMHDIGMVAQVAEGRQVSD